LEFKQLLDAGVHFGHLKRKWNPNMAPYIFDEKKGIHIIDLNKTAVKLEEAAAAMKSIARGGKKVLFVATKKQAKDIVTEKGEAHGHALTSRSVGAVVCSPTSAPSVAPSRRWPPSIG
jgi:small subunit ribosomal protein S2